MEVLVNDSGTASFTYTSPQNTVSLVYSVYDNTNDQYIQYEEVDFIKDLGTISTISIASPTAIIQQNHPLNDGDAIKFSTTGSLPTGINTDTVYYVLTTGNPSEFNIYTTSPDNLINTTGTQSGVHKVLSQGIATYEITLNADSCKYDRDLVIEIQSIQINGYSTDSIDVKIKRPYATISEITSYFDTITPGSVSILNDFSVAFVEKLERKVRYLINAYIIEQVKNQYKN